MADRQREYLATKRQRESLVLGLEHLILTRYAGYPFRNG